MLASPFVFSVNTCTIFPFLRVTYGRWGSRGWRVDQSRHHDCRDAISNYLSHRDQHGEMASVRCCSPAVSGERCGHKQCVRTSYMSSNSIDMSDETYARINTGGLDVAC